MKLDAAYVIVFVFEPHNLSFVTFCRNLQTVGKFLFGYHPRVVTAHHNALGQSFEYFIISKLSALCGYSVEHVAEVDQLGTEHFADGLMTEADTQYRFHALISFDDIQQQSCFFWDARTRTNDDFIESLKVSQFKLVISVYRHVSSQFFDKVGEIIRERIVIVYNNYFHDVITYLPPEEWLSLKPLTCCLPPAVHILHYSLPRCRRELGTKVHRCG